MGNCLSGGFSSSQISNNMGKGLKSESVVLASPRSTPHSRVEPKSTSLKKCVVIPVDLVIEILSRLRTKPLMRLRCVSKSWNLITHDPQFVSCHLNRMSNMPCLNIVILPLFDHCSLHYFAEDWHRLDTVSSEQKDGFRKTRFISYSCNGLICAYNWDTIYVTNPSINKSLKLPKLSVYIYSVAICHDTATGDYKVACIYNLETSVARKHFRMGCSVFTLGSSSWRFVGQLPIRVSSIPRPVIANGLVFWTVSYYDRELAVAVSFDIHNEIFDTIEHPRGILFSSSVHNIVEMGGHMCTYEWLHYEIVLWILTDYNSREWMKYVINIGFTRNSDVAPVTIRGASILFTGPPRSTERVDFYDLNTQKMEQPLYLTVGDVMPYVESLINPVTVHENARDGILHVLEGVATQPKPWWEQNYLEEHDTPSMGSDRGRKSWRQFEGFNLREGVYGKMSREQVESYLPRKT